MSNAARNLEPATDREHTISRTYPAPARLLFLAYSKPEHISRWYGPVGWPITMCEMDFRVGGRWRFAMTGDSGVQNTPFGGQYLEIVPNEKIVYDTAFEEPGSPTMVTTVTFDEQKNGRTTLTIHTLFESVAMKDEYLGVGMEEGIISGLDQLAGVVVDLATRESA